jgi:hypothetical protein
LKGENPALEMGLFQLLNCRNKAVAVAKLAKALAPEIAKRRTQST